MGGRLATIDIGRKLGAVHCAPFGVAELGSHVTQYGLGRGLHSYKSGFLIHPAVYPQQA